MMHYTLLVLADSMNEVEALMAPYQALMAPYQENSMDDIPREYLKFFDCMDETWHDEDTGNNGYWENPNAEWDWYELGGRWDGRIVTKDGKHVSSCPVAEIDTSVPPFDSNAVFHTYAALTPDGEWHKCGTINSNSEAYASWCDSFAERYIEPYRDKTAYLIDYHL